MYSCLAGSNGYMGISPHPTPLIRMWGRFLGVAFLVPGSYFLARGFINGALGRRLGLLFLMGGTQGLVGWWMVRSGLQVCIRADKGELIHIVR